MAKILAEILPEGVVNIVLGRGESVGNALINHPKINMVSITGDVATGKKVLQAAAKSVKRTHLELGGKAPVIVFDDADLDAVVDGLRAFGYYNAGQDCTAACRIYAGPKIYDKLVAKADTKDSTIGMLLSDPQLYHNLSDSAERIKLMTDEARLLIEKWKAEGLPIRVFN